MIADAKALLVVLCQATSSKHGGAWRLARTQARPAHELGHNSWRTSLDNCGGLLVHMGWGMTATIRHILQAYRYRAQRAYTQAELQNKRWHKTKSRVVKQILKTSMSRQYLVQVMEDMALEIMPRNIEKNKASELWWFASLLPCF